MKHSYSSYSCFTNVASFLPSPSFLFYMIFLRWVTSFVGVNTLEKGVEQSSRDSMLVLSLILYSLVYLRKPVDVWSLDFISGGFWSNLVEEEAPLAIFLKPSER